jgi:hypothetical protein
MPLDFFFPIPVGLGMANQAKAGYIVAFYHEINP